MKKETKFKIKPISSKKRLISVEDLEEGGARPWIAKLEMGRFYKFGDFRDGELSVIAEIGDEIVWGRKNEKQFKGTVEKSDIVDRKIKSRSKKKWKKKTQKTAVDNRHLCCVCTDNLTWNSDGICNECQL